MFDRLGDPAATAPIGTPNPPTKLSKVPGALRLLTVGVLAFALANVTARLDLAALVSHAGDTIARSPAVRTITGNAPADSATVTALKSVIESANLAQAKALAQNDPSLMRGTATDGYYQELVQTNRDLADSGVTSIELVKLDWGDVTVDGNTAHATTFETWRSFYDDGSSDQRTDRNDYTLVLQNGSWRISADAQPGARVIDPTTVTTPAQTDTSQPGTPAASASHSSNWSGYVASGGSFTAVSASWVVPQVSATSTGADATWVGIGGLRTNDLIQAGTQAEVSGGQARYSAWVEMLPQASRTVSLSVAAGDSVTVSITQAPSGEWTIAMKNDTTGQSYTTTVRYASTNASAEWIQEAPSSGRGVVPLDNFGTIRFTNASAVRDGQRLGLAQLGARAIAMINGQGQVTAQPSQLDADGSGFSVTRTNASSNPTGTNPQRRRP